MTDTLIVEAVSEPIAQVVEAPKATFTDEEVEKIIRDCIAKCQANGIVIKQGEWGTEYKKDTWVLKHKKEKTCCALDCVILQSQEEDDKFKNDWRSWVLTEKLHRDFFWLTFFYRGFDNSPLGDSEKLDQAQQLAYAMGKKISMDFVPETETTEE